MDLKQVQTMWERFGQADPLWAILTDPNKTNNRWDLEDFFQTGRADILAVLQRISSLDVPLRGGRALDFGCGVGRLSQALCEHFDSVTGIDIARPMIDEANRINRHPDRCQYLVNDAPDLSLLPDESYDFVLTWIVLQHMKPEDSASYLRELFRVLRPGGVAVFQIPSHKRQAVRGDAIRSLPRKAFRASIDAQSAPDKLAAGDSAVVRVQVRNDSPVAWEVEEQFASELRVGNHWLDEAGAMIVQDDGRASLPNPLCPGEEAEVDLQVTAPNQPGQWTLEIDLVQEFVAWFQKLDSPSWRGAVTVTAAAAPAISAEEMSRFMWMDGIPKEDVIALVNSCNAEILTADEDNSAPGWVSFGYFARKADRQS